MSGPRYWRAVGFETASRDVEMSELALYSAGSRVDTSATLTASYAPVAGALANLSDATTSTTCRFGASQVRAANFALVWDFGGTGATVDGLRIGAGSDDAAFPQQVQMQSSTDGTTWSDAITWAINWPGASTIIAAERQSDQQARGLLLCGGNTDESKYKGAVTLYSGANWVAGAGPFGGYALSPSGGYARLPANASLPPGSAPWTVEGWIYTTSTADQEILMLGKSSNPGYANMSIGIISGGIGVVIGNGSSWVNTVSYYGGTVPQNAWVYFEIVRVSGYIKAAINSTDVVSYSDSGVNLVAISPGDIVIGQNVGLTALPMPFQGLIGGLRYTQGVALRGSGGPLAVPTAMWPALGALPLWSGRNADSIVGYSAPADSAGSTTSSIKTWDGSQWNTAGRVVVWTAP